MCLITRITLNYFNLIGGLYAFTLLPLIILNLAAMMQRCKAVYDDAVAKALDFGR